jgi:hypothetical protein
MQVGATGSPDERIASYADFRPVATLAASRHAQRPGIEKLTKPCRADRPSLRSKLTMLNPTAKRRI